MGVYCYKISRKSRVVHGCPSALGEKVFLAEFAYKCGYYDDNEVSHRRRVAPTERAWRKVMDEGDYQFSDIYFVMDMESGAPVYRRTGSIDWLDGGEHGEIVGYLERFPSGWGFRPAKVQKFLVSFQPYEHLSHRDPLQVTVDALCPLGAARAARKLVDEDGPYGSESFQYYSRMNNTVERIAC